MDTHDPGPRYTTRDELAAARCGYCGSVTGDHTNCKAAFDNGATWAAHDEGYLLKPPALAEVLELAAIRGADDD
jgi:hypothetical protein